MANTEVNNSADIIASSCTKAVTNFVPHSSNNITNINARRSMEATNVTNVYLNENISDNKTFGSESASDIAEYIEIDTILRSIKDNIGLVSHEGIYDEPSGIREITDTEVHQLLAKYNENEVPNGSHYIEVLPTNDATEKQPLSSHTIDDICSNDNNVNCTTSIPENMDNKPIQFEGKNAQETTELFEDVQTNSKSIGDKLGFMALRKTNQIIQAEGPIQRPRCSLQMTTFESTPDTSKYDCILKGDNYDERKEHSRFNSGVGDTQDGMTITPGEFEYDTILTRKCVGSDVEYDRLLNIDNVNKKEQLLHGSYTKELSKTGNAVIQDLIETEAKYLKKLKHLVEDYLHYFRKTNVSSDIETVFGNVEELYKETEKMYAEMKGCTSADEIANVFIRNANIFDYYTDFVRNRCTSHLLVNEVFGQLIKDRQSELKDRQSCESYLISAVRRPVKYKLLLEKLQRALTENDASYHLLQEAIILVQKKMQEMNTVLAVGCVQRCSVNLDEMGKFLMKDVFNTKFEEKTVLFLFEKCVVCCTADKLNFDSYNFVCCIELDTLSLRHCESSNSFEISCFDKLKAHSKNNQFRFHLEADLMSMKKKWVNEIQKILWNQLEYCKEQQTLNANRQKQLTESIYEELDAVVFQKEIRTFGQGKYYSLRNASYEDIRNTPGIFFDGNFCPRIEIIGSDVQLPKYICPSAIPLAQMKLFKDLLADEEAYLKYLRTYISSFYLSTGRVSWYKLAIFAHIEEVHKETEKLYVNLLYCNTIDAIANAFLESTQMFVSYTNYIRNKASHDYITMELNNNRKPMQEKKIPRKENKGDDYLVQRLFMPAKYKSFLEKLQTQLKNANKDSKLLNDAVKFVNDEITRATTLLNIDFIHKCPFDLKITGNFIKKGVVQLKDKWECVLVLFENILMLCLNDDYHPDNCLYFDSIEMDKLAIRDVRHPVEFQLRTFYSSKEGERINCSFDIVASSTTTKQEWIRELDELVWKYLKSYRRKENEKFSLL